MQLRCRTRDKVVRQNRAMIKSQVCHRSDKASVDSRLLVAGEEVCRLDGDVVVELSASSTSSVMQPSYTRTHDITLAGYTHTHPFNGSLSGTTQMSRRQKGKTNLDFTKARDSEWQWHQLGHMQVCTSLKTDNHTSTALLSFYRPDALPAAQPTASKH